jgi:hypothetical protein
VTPEDRTARSRFFVIGAVRLAGAVTVALAVAIAYGRIDGVPGEVGYGLLVLGVIELLVLPQMLVARWKSPPPKE